MIITISGGSDKLKDDWREDLLVSGIAVLFVIRRERALKMMDCVLKLVSGQ